MGHVEEPGREVLDAVPPVGGDLAVQPDESLLHHVLPLVVGVAQHPADVTQQRALVMRHDGHQVAGPRRRDAPKLFRGNASRKLTQLDRFSIHYSHRREI